MLDILMPIAESFSDWLFVIFVFLAPPLFILYGILSDISDKKESEKRFDLYVKHFDQNIKFESVRYELSRYTKEVHIISDNGNEFWLSYEFIEVREVS